MLVNAERKDKALVVEILSRALEKELSVVFTAGNGPGRMVRVKRLMGYAFDICFCYGEIYLNNQRTGCALMRFPNGERYSPFRSWLELKLITGVIGFLRVGKVLRQRKMFASYYPLYPFVYLWFMGIDPDWQGFGMGTEMLADLLCKQLYSGLPLYLETSSEEHLSWYRDFGFELFAEVDIGHKLFFLRY